MLELLDMTTLFAITAFILGVAWFIYGWAVVITTLRSIKLNLTFNPIIHVISLAVMFNVWVILLILLTKHI